MKVITLSCRCRLADLVPNVRRHSTVAPAQAAERTPHVHLTAEVGQRGQQRLPSAA